MNSTQGITESTSVVRTVAVVDIGATSVRMAIADIDGSGAVRTHETLTQPVEIGKDTFNKNFISKRTIEDCVRVLKSYGRKLREYQITQPDQIRVIATSAVREASNRLAFQDRIFIATGFVVDVLDEAEASRVTYMGVLPYLETDTSTHARSLIVEAGGGSTEVLVTQGRNVVVSHTYRLGALRLRQSVESIRAPWGKKRSLMENEIRHVTGLLKEDFRARGPIQMIALGGDVRFAARHLQPGWSPAKGAALDTNLVEAFTDQLLGLSVEETVDKYQLTFQDAETTAAALMIYIAIARMYDVRKFLVINSNLRDGLLEEMALNGAWTEELREQVVRSAIDLGRKFHFDEGHARHVADLSRVLFTELQEIHGLDSRHELILYIGALLHEIGLYVSQRAYHKHSMYLIRHSELFGLGVRDLMLVALVARYHRRNTPQPNHPGYGTLDREQRIAVSKMAAILRLATTLEHTRSQRIRDLTCELRQGRLVISTSGADDVTLEQVAMERNSAMFESVFGMQVLLRSSAV